MLTCRHFVAFRHDLIIFHVCSIHLLIRNSMKIAVIALDRSRCGDSFRKEIFCDRVSAVVDCNGDSLFVFLTCSHQLLYLYDTSINPSFDDESRNGFRAV